MTSTTQSAPASRTRRAQPRLHLARTAAALLLLAACTGDGTPTRPTPPPPGAGLVLAFAAPRDTVFLTEAVPFVATAQAGSLTGVRLLWSVDDTTIATVSDAGVVTGRGEGRTTLRVRGAAASASAPLVVTRAPIRANTLTWGSSLASLLTVDSGAVSVLLGVRDAVGAVQPTSAVTVTLEDSAGVFAYNATANTLRVVRNGWAQARLVARRTGDTAVVATVPLQSTGWLARPIFGSNVPETARREFAAAWAMWASRLQDTLVTRTRTFAPFGAPGGRNGITDAMVVDSTRTTNRVLVIVEYGSFRTTAIVASASRYRQLDNEPGDVRLKGMVIQLNADRPEVWLDPQLTREVLAHEIGHGLGIGWWGNEPGMASLLRNVTAPGATTPTGFQFTGPRATAVLRSMGLSPSWWPGVPVKGQTHWAVGGRSSLMSETGERGARLSLLDFASLQDVGYSVHTTGLTPPPFLFEAPWSP